MLTSNLCPSSRIGVIQSAIVFGRRCPLKPRQVSATLGSWAVTRINWPMGRASAVSMSVLLCSVAPVPAGSGFASYEYQVDSFEIIGNLPGNAIDEFDDDVLDGWCIAAPTVVEANGVVTLMTPGALRCEVNFPGITLELERSTLETCDSSRFRVQGGSGDFTATSRWVSAVPEQNELYGMGLFYDVLDVDKDINLRIYNVEPAIADAVGVPSGLAMWFEKYEGSGPVGDIQAVPISEKDITGDVLLRLIFDDDANEIMAEFSLDGGMTFRCPFLPFTSNLDMAGSADWGLDAFGVRVISACGDRERRVVLLDGAGERRCADRDVRADGSRHEARRVRRVCVS
jgi:hypothetical protein